MLHCYMDASGSHDQAAQCLVAGYWGGKNEWGRFERAWNAVLDSEGIEEFHAKIFWPRFDGKRLGPYKAWSDQRHRAFMDRLLTVIQNHKIIPFGCGVDIAEWNKQPAFYRKIYSGFHQTAPVKDNRLKAVFLSFQMAVAKSASYCRRGVKMHFFFDKDPQVMGRITECYAALGSDPETRNDPLINAMGDLNFSDSKDSAPIQAADLLAYELYHYSKSRSKPRPEMVRALWRFKNMNDFWLFDATRFERLKERLEQSAKAEKGWKKNQSSKLSMTPCERFLPFRTTNCGDARNSGNKSVKKKKSGRLNLPLRAALLAQGVS